MLGRLTSVRWGAALLASFHHGRRGDGSGGQGKNSEELHVGVEKCCDSVVSCIYMWIEAEVDVVISRDDVAIQYHY
jgi:hypothetical protein